MIDKIRIAVDMLDPNWPLNDGEDASGVKILCSTNPAGRSKDSRSISYQLEHKLKVNFSHEVRERFMWNLWDIFLTPEFAFWDKIKSRAYAIVCHDGGDYHDQDFSRAKNWLEIWLDRIHSKVSVTDEASMKRIWTEYDQSLKNRNFKHLDATLKHHEEVVRQTRLKMEPLVRTPLMAPDSIEDCARLFDVMDMARAKLVIYMHGGSHAVVKAMLLKFPRYYKKIPALADEELQLAA